MKDNTRNNQSKPLKKLYQAMMLQVRKAFKPRVIKRALKCGAHDIPIFLISYNRLTYLKQMIEWLENYGYRNITIIDNNSDYAPLLDYFDKCSYRIVHMKKNYGYRVFFIHPRFIIDRNKGLFVLTDPDLCIDDDCPNDFIEIFCKIMLENLHYSKVGFSLRIDDIPDSYYAKAEVIDWESQFWETCIERFPLPAGGDVRIFEAEIDTTFAVNTPRWLVNRSDRYSGIRVGYPYCLRHLPWYSEMQDEDELAQYARSIKEGETNWNGNYTNDELRLRMDLKSGE